MSESLMVSRVKSLFTHPSGAIRAYTVQSAGMGGSEKMTFQTTSGKHATIMPRNSNDFIVVADARCVLDSRCIENPLEALYYMIWTR